MEKDVHKLYLIQLGKSIESHRIEQKLSKVQLAFEIGTSESNIRRIEKGQTNPSIIMLVRIANALNLVPKELLPN